MFKSRRLVGKLVRCKGRSMLRLKSKGILILELMRSESVRIEAVEMGLWRGLTSMYAAF